MGVVSHDSLDVSLLGSANKYGFRCTATEKSHVSPMLLEGEKST